MPIQEGTVPAPTKPIGKYEADKTIPASVTWETPTIEIAVDEKTMHVDFKFTGKNTSDGEIKIPYVRLSCGCQDVRLNALTFAPGASVEVTGRMTFPAASGRYERPLEIYTDKGGSTTLKVAAVGPIRIAFSHSSLEWAEGDKSPQKVTITTHSPDTVQGIQVLGGGFGHTIAKEGTETHITVTPDGSNTRGAVRVMEKTSNRPTYITLSYGAVPQPETATAPKKAPPAAQSPTTAPANPAAPARPTEAEAQSDLEEMRSDVIQARALLEAALKKLEAH